jgi:Fis family transcriptional regulator
VRQINHDEAGKTGSIAGAVQLAVSEYLQLLADEDVQDLYALVLSQVEPAVLASVLDHVGYNQSKAAQLLGLSRGTLRTKLRKYGLT